MSDTSSTRGLAPEGHLTLILRRLHYPTVLPPRFVPDAPQAREALEDGLQRQEGDSVAYLPAGKEMFDGGDAREVGPTFDLHFSSEELPQ